MQVPIEVKRLRVLAVVTLITIVVLVQHIMRKQDLGDRVYLIALAIFFLAAIIMVNVYKLHRKMDEG